MLLLKKYIHFHWRLVQQLVSQSFLKFLKKLSDFGILTAIVFNPETAKSRMSNVLFFLGSIIVKGPGQKMINYFICKVY